MPETHTAGKRNGGKRIGDFGAHIAGARKEGAAAGRGSAREAGPRERQAGGWGKSRALSTFWPAPDWTLTAETAGPETAAWLRAVRDELRSARTLAADEYLRASGRTALSTVAGLVARGEKSIAEAEHELRRGSMETRAHAETVTERALAYRTFGHRRDLRCYGIEEGPEGFTLLVIRGGTDGAWKARVGETHAKPEALLAVLERRVKRKKENRRTYWAGSSKEEDGTVQWGVMRKHGGRWRLFHECETLEDARQLAADPARRGALDAEWAGYTDIPGERCDDAPREREPAVPPRAVEPERFLQATGLRGVQFGNYVQIARRGACLAEAQQALADLAAAIGWTTEELGLGGMLGLAFGARGQGGARRVKAHYEPGEQVINLSRDHGAGAFAHEWFHAFDHAVCRTGRPACAEGAPAADLATRTEPDGGAGVPEAEAHRLLAALGQRLRYSLFGRRSLRLDVRRSGDPYWATPEEMCARAFEAVVERRLREAGVRNGWLVSFRDGENWREAGGNDATGTIPASWPYPDTEEAARLEPDFMEVLAAGRKRLAETRAERKSGAGETAGRAA